MNYDFYLNKLSKSNFRSKFKLKQKDFDYIHDKGLFKIKQHAYDFITKRLSPELVVNDGKQTPMRGHPVFIAQHATELVVEVAFSNGTKFPKTLR